MRHVIGYFTVSLLFLVLSACLMFMAAVYNAEQLKQHGGCKVLIHEFICAE